MPGVAAFGVPSPFRSISFDHPTEISFTDTTYVTRYTDYLNAASGKVYIIHAILLSAEVKGDGTSTVYARVLPTIELYNSDDDTWDTLTCGAVVLNDSYDVYAKRMALQAYPCEYADYGQVGSYTAFGGPIIGLQSGDYVTQARLKLETQSKVDTGTGWIKNIKVMVIYTEHTTGW